MLSDVVGAKVAMLPGVKEQNKAAKKNENPEHPVGKIGEILLDCCSGRTQWAVVTFDKTLGFGGKTVAVPCDELHWDATNERFDLDQTDDQLKALPSFDVDDAKKNGLDLTVATLSPFWPNSATSHRNDDTADGKQKDVDMTKPSKITVDGKEFECAKPHLITSKELRNTAVYADSEKFGVIGDALVLRTDPSVAFLIVSRGGTLGVGDSQYLIPYYAACLHAGGDSKEMVYGVHRSLKELEAGVHYEKPKYGCVDAEAITRTNEMFAKDRLDPRSGKPARD